MRGKRLVACKVRETRVGRGAFVTIGAEIVEEGGDVLAHRLHEVLARGFVMGGFGQHGMGRLDRHGGLLSRMPISMAAAAASR